MEINIGKNIKQLRISKDITQEQLSEAMNVSCAAVSKWERGETFPDITLLQPLAYYFDVTLDELMGYNKEKVQAKIDEIIRLYREYWDKDYNKARDIIVKAYHDHPNDYWIMHYYMWNIGGDMADNDPNILLEHKEEFLAICNKILEGCSEETIRLNAWNMRAKILHAEGKTDDALEIYNTKFTDWYSTSAQKIEQLFAKDTNEYYYYVQKNMYALADFAADKLGRTLFFNTKLSLEEKAIKALTYGDLLIKQFNETKEPFFIVLAKSFLGRMENDLVYRGGSNEAIIKVMDKNLLAVKLLSECMASNKPLYDARRPSFVEEDILQWNINYRLNADSGRRGKLLKIPAYVEILNKYKNQ